MKRVDLKRQTAQSLIAKPGPVTMNGPGSDGMAVRCDVEGQTVLIIAADPEVALGVAEAIGRRVSQPTHVLLGQPPWYCNQTRDHDLGDLLCDS